MFLDLFIVQRGLTINQKKAERAIKTAMPVTKQFWQARNWDEINKTKKTNFYYGVIYDNEWFESRLIKDLSIILVKNMNIEMFTLFVARGDGKVRFEPRIFSSNLLLNVDIKNQPLPYNHEKLHHEKLLGGWLYVD